MTFQHYPASFVFSEELRRLFDACWSAREKAYAPYSQFKVGASILLENGEIVEGSNQENAVYPLGLCAERTAFFTYGHQYRQLKAKAIAVAAESLDPANPKPIFPCGSCRQVIREYECIQNQPIKIYVLSKEQGVWELPSAEELLPFSFGSEFLNKGL